jgi:YD repeat-containing protein
MGVCLLTGHRQILCVRSFVWLAPLLCAGALSGACSDATRHQDGDVPKVIAPAVLKVGNSSQVEGNFGTRSLVFDVTVETVSTSPSSFSIDTIDGTAIGGVDYVVIRNAGLQVPPGPWSGQVEVAILGDEEFEPEETFTLRLTSRDADSTAMYEGTGIITNDDLRQDLTLGVIYDYDELGRLKSVHYDNGRSVQYTYDAAGNVLSVTSQGG